MAIAIKNIPTLKGEVASSFIEAADKAERKRATVNFEKQIQSARAILAKSKRTQL